VNNVLITGWPKEPLDERLLKAMKLLHLWDCLSDAEFQRALSRLKKQCGKWAAKQNRGKPRKPKQGA